MRALAAGIIACLCVSGCGGGGGDPVAGDMAAAIGATSSLSPSPTASPSPSPSPTTTPASGATPSTPDLIWGANGHPTTAYGAVTVDEQMGILSRLGLKQYRVGSESLDKVEEMLASAGKHGVTLLPVITPDLAFDAHSAAEIYANSYRTAYEAAFRFRGRIKVWELGNELEGYAIIQPCELRDDGTKYPCEWGPAGGVAAQDYVGARWAKVSAALKGMSDGVKAGDPSALRAAGSAGWGHTGSFERMKADGIGWEISVWHQYRVGEDEWAYKTLSGYGKPIWVTEFGTNSLDGEDRQADLLKAIMTELRAMRRYGVANAFVYELLDEPYWTDGEGKMGLVHLVKDNAGRWILGSDKPAAQAVKSTIQNTQ